ncbi:MAG: DUF1772 domain-containing protein [Alphaproteobacteria bacterium]|nr:DUF1772 domain-containing protein [Alphaproteobacteria bacterium]MCW5743038.1 DUF1772 domain-containing protein [Alphaproteobacteria bacterium]
MTLVFRLLATLLFGLTAGFFFAFAIDVAPALARTESSAAIAVFQQINIVVRNAWFGAVYFGAVVVPPVALALVWRDRRSLGWWLGLAAWLVYLGGVQAPTAAINVPINQVVAAWTPTVPAGDWRALLERWTAFNTLRTIAATAAFALSLAGLVLPAARRP